jgi:hypothetical protein
MQKLFTKREKFIATMTLAIIAIFIFFNFVFEPVLRLNTQLNKKIAVDSYRLKKYLFLLDKKEFYNEQLRKLKEVFPDFEKNGNTPVAMFSIIENMAKTSGIKVVDMRPEKGASNLANKREFVVNVRTQGNMPEHMKFIYNLENSLLSFKIKKFSLNFDQNRKFVEGVFVVSNLTFSN